MNKPRRLPPPRRSATIRESGAIGLGGDMQARQRVAHCGAMGTIWMLDRRAIDPRHEAGRPAVQHREQCAGAIGLRRRRLDACTRQVGHQVEVERKLLRRQPHGTEVRLGKYLAKASE